MSQLLKADIIIIGGGVAGLWTLNVLRQQGYSVLLLEKEKLGHGQTIKSQGILHGGMKYALQGKITKEASSVSHAPFIWKECLEGRGVIDLKKVSILSHQQYLWSPSKLTGKLSGFFAGLALKGQIHSLKKSNFPPVFQQPEFKGTVHALDEWVINVHELVTELAKPYQKAIIHAPQLNKKYFDFNEKGFLNAISLGQNRLVAQHYIFSAGERNETLLSTPMQKRPLHMVLMKNKSLPLLFGHCMGLSSKPRITITTHKTADQEWIWYLGGELAEEGMLRTSSEQIKQAKQEIANLFPWLNLENAKWASFFVNRAEEMQTNGQKPDSYSIKEQGNCLIIWPTKLVLAPLLSEAVLEHLKHANVISQYKELNHSFVFPGIAQPIWDQLV